jgi:hypothetical protein
MSKEGQQAASCGPRYGLFVGYLDQARETDLGFECLVATGDDLASITECAGDVLPGFWWQLVDLREMEIIMCTADLSQKKH